VKPTDRKLGMDRRISRRDILHGVGALAATSLIPGQSLADEILAREAGSAGSAGYPPALTGMRGNHDGSFDVIHQLAREVRRDWGPRISIDRRIRIPTSSFSTITMISAATPGVTSSILPAAS